MAVATEESTVLYFPKGVGMKKLLIVSAILLAVAAVVFYFGWIQIQLPENTYAVIFTKTRGWDETVTEPGKFSWRWERLVPTNLTLHKFVLEPHTTTFSYSGELPSGALYAGIIEPRPDFTYSVSFAISFTLRPESLPQLITEERMVPEQLPEFYDRMATSIATRASAVLNTLARSEDHASLIASVSPEIAEILISRISGQFTSIDIHRILPTRVEMPDIELYQVAKEQFLAVARSREQSRIDQMAATVRTDTRIEQHFLVLERYGSLLETYPVLIDLFNLKEGRLDEILNEIDSMELPAKPESTQ